MPLGTIVTESVPEANVQVRPVFQVPDCVLAKVVFVILPIALLPAFKPTVVGGVKVVICAAVSTTGTEAAAKA